MQGVVFLGDRQMGLQEFPDPAPGPGQVVVRMRAAGLCGSDLKPYRSSSEELAERTSVICGHEPCGVVEEVGAETRNLRRGDRVMVHHYSGCGRCNHCETGWAQLCQNGMTLYGSTAHGSNADYQLVTDQMCVPMPDELSFEEGAACSCGTGTAYQALRRLEISGRDTLVVFGQGPVGLSATLLGVAMGARVVAVDPVIDRRTLAIRFGAVEVIDPESVDPVQAVLELTHGVGADASLDATGIDMVRVTAVRSTKIWGRTCLVGEGGTATFEPSSDIIHRQLTLLGSWTFSTDILEELGRYVVDQSIPLGDLITHRFRLQDAEEAYRLFDTSTTGKPAFVWD